MSDNRKLIDSMDVTCIIIAAKMLSTSDLYVDTGLLDIGLIRYLRLVNALKKRFDGQDLSNPDAIAVIIANYKNEHPTKTLYG